jgi:hypothetical protein
VFVLHVYPKYFSHSSGTKVNVQQESALVPIAQRIVEWQGDELVAVLVDNGEGNLEVYVPLRPLCDYLGLAWVAQFERLKRDPVLAEVIRGIRITRTPGRGGGSQEMICLPLKFLNGWLFGVQVSRVKEEFREKVLQYQRECYDILAQAFQTRSMTQAESSLAQIREMGLAIARMAEQQMLFEQGLAAAHSRLDQAALVVGGLQKRVSTLEKRLSPDEQAAEISNRMRDLVLLLTEDTTRKTNTRAFLRNSTGALG